MKTIIIVVAIFLAITSCNRIPKEERVLVKGAADSVLVVAVPKARCYKCQNIIEGGLKEVKGVQQSILNLHTKEVSIVYTPDLTNPEALEGKVANLIPQLPCK
ncbi:cation transporter [Aureispira anguillae]|uniref:Cation transporter n=1 Tax=Aureispira anguillae TaxID=2864201 RepID=A0A916DPG9_9BACT|nr:cation transporter [Aureispira anguillae]BDS10524.1 cation transporter [Aureispira anguillae]